MLAPPVRVPGTAVFLTADKGVVPHALMHNLKHNKVLHERNVFLTVETLSVPFAAKDKRLKIEEIGDEFHRVLIRFGFMETPDRSEEHTSELQSLMRISYAVFCLQNKKKHITRTYKSII